ncbi:enoyl-CoA hydratase/isomerase family protein [Nocardia sp. alder85J]|uniref:enoyl-CoA hydratase/isomerase family protein n=1 Tax=Nocardia sp. alder85J TaxID=2862949 RepID=UPI001CD32FC7|nr:enoyl-CoA hydratase/isomerase family protein [Nocardia sp. alder85J]MCX4095704.1 enoyl-CoA hydratase/isomerase family protein [Nocardia sp. alder85J]
MTAPAPILVTDSGPVRTLTLNRPGHRNALDPELIDALEAALTDAEADATVGCLILTGAGKSFCAGGDLQYFLSVRDNPGGPTQFLRRVSAVVTRFERSRLPVVAAVHGHAVAGGLELALACDVVVASAGTLIGDGHIRNNLLPAAGSSVRLPRKVGDSMARWLALTGALLPAEQLTTTGWLHAVVPDAELNATAHALAAELTAAAGPAQSAFKSLLHDLTGLHEDDGLAAELTAFEKHWNNTDVPAALTAFLHRRPPRTEEENR